MESLFGQKYIKAHEQGMDMDETSSLGAKFRHRFRIPFSMFLKIVDCYIIDHGGWQHKHSHDIRIKVLVALRYLSTGCSFDVLEESSSIGEETCRTFTHHFCSWFRERFRSTHIHLPLTEAEITHVEGLYGHLGLPGCIGSADCVHIPWEKCPAGLLSSCKGKEGYPTLVFEVVVSHTRKILSVSSVFFGADNDKTIAQFDPAINEVRNGSYSETEWEHCCYDDTRVKEFGYYFICKGGYFCWKCLMSPVQNRSAGSDVDLVEVYGIGSKGCRVHIWYSQAAVPCTQTQCSASE